MPSNSPMNDRYFQTEITKKFHLCPTWDGVHCCDSPQYYWWSEPRRTFLATFFLLITIHSMRWWFTAVQYGEAIIFNLVYNLLILHRLNKYYLKKCWQSQYTVSFGQVKERTKQNIEQGNVFVENEDAQIISQRIWFPEQDVDVDESTEHPVFVGRVPDFHEPPIHCIGVLYYNEPECQLYNLVQDILDQPSRGQKVLMIGMEKGTPEKQRLLKNVEALVNRQKSSAILLRDIDEGGDKSGEAEDINNSIAVKSLSSEGAAEEDPLVGEKNDIIVDEVTCKESWDDDSIKVRNVDALLFTVHTLRPGEVAGTGSNVMCLQAAAERVFNSEELQKRVLFTKIDCNCRISKNFLIEMEDAWSNMKTENQRLSCTMCPLLYWSSERPDWERNCVESAWTHGLLTTVGLPFMVSLVSGSLRGIIEVGYTPPSLLSEDEILDHKKKALLVNKDGPDVTIHSDGSTTIISNDIDNCYRLTSVVVKVLPADMQAFSFLEKVAIIKMKRWFLGASEVFAYLSVWLAFGSKSLAAKEDCEHWEQQKEIGNKANRTRTTEHPEIKNKKWIAGLLFFAFFRMYMVTLAVQTIPIVFRTVRALLIFAVDMIHSKLGTDGNKESPNYWAHTIFDQSDLIVAFHKAFGIVSECVNPTTPCSWIDYALLFVFLAKLSFILAALGSQLIYMLAIYKMRRYICEGAIFSSGGRGNSIGLRFNLGWHLWGQVFSIWTTAFFGIYLVFAWFWHGVRNRHPGHVMMRFQKEHKEPLSLFKGRT